MCRRIISQEKKSLGGLNPRGILVREENFGGKPTGRKKFGGKMGPSRNFKLENVKNQVQIDRASFNQLMKEGVVANS